MESCTPFCTMSHKISSQSYCINKRHLSYDSIQQFSMLASNSIANQSFSSHESKCYEIKFWLTTFKGIVRQELKTNLRFMYIPNPIPHTLKKRENLSCLLMKKIGQLKIS